MDDEEAKRDEDLLERWCWSQGISQDVITQHVEEARAKLLSVRDTRGADGPAA